MPAGNAGSNSNPTPGSPSSSAGRGFATSWNKFTAFGYDLLGKAADAVAPAAQGLVKAENRVKVAVLQARQSGIDAGAAAADTADKGLKVAAGVVNKLKWIYIGLGALVVIYFLAKTKEIFKGATA